MIFIGTSRLCLLLRFSFLNIAFISISSFAQVPPDLILHNAKIITVDQQFRIVQALAITGDRISATGSNASIFEIKRQIH
jgi:hypothetical protein